MQDRPTAAELLDAVAGFLEEDVAPLLDARLRFHARVAINVLRILQREGELGPSQLARQREVLAALLGRDAEVPELWAELASAIRDGDFDRREAELLPALREITEQKLAIANPRYTSHDELA